MKIVYNIHRPPTLTELVLAHSHLYWGPQEKVNKIRDDLVGSRRYTCGEIKCTVRRTELNPVGCSNRAVCKPARSTGWYKPC